VTEEIQEVSMEQALTEIIDGMLPATENDKNFANSLLNGQYGLRKRGYLTPNQYNAAVKMYDRLQSPPTPDDKTADLGKVYAFMMGARRFLKYPKINLLLNDDTEHPVPLKLYISGARSKYPDTINLVANQNDWYGRVFQDGTWHHPRRINESVMVKIKDLMAKLAEDPATVAVEHGRLTGNCCFCNRKLTDKDHSVKVGFGPVCADHWGLKDFWKMAAKDDRAPAAAHVAHMIKTGKKLNTQNEETADRKRRLKVKRNV